MSLVIDRLQEHYKYATKDIDMNNVIGITLTGSQNYGTDLPTSDVDTQLIITPTLEEVYKGNKPDSTTKMMEDSEEHIKIKDVRQFIKEIKKQNLNVIECLYTDYCIINPIYKDIWSNLIAERDKIARINPVLAVKAIKGNALNSLDRIYLTDGSISFKQVANLVRYDYYLNQYIANKPFLECMQPDEETRKYILQIRNGELGESSLRTIAETSGDHIRKIVDDYVDNNKDFVVNQELIDFLDETCKEFIDSSFLVEYAKRGMI